MISNLRKTRKNIKKAVKLVYNTLALTLGPNGRNVIINRNDRLFITNDGLTILENMQTNNPEVQTVIKIIADGSLSTDRLVKDGTTSTALIASKLYLLSRRRRIKNYYSFISGVEASLKEATELLNEYSKHKLTKEEIRNIANVATNDLYLGKLVYEAYQKVNFNGRVEAIKTDKLTTSIELEKDFIINAEVESNYFLDEALSLEMNNPLVLIFDREVAIDEAKTIAAYSKSRKLPVLIIVEKKSDDVVNQFVTLKLQDQFSGLIIRLLENGLEMTMAKHDISVIANAKIVHHNEEISEEHYGSLSRIEFNQRIIKLVVNNSNKERIDKLIKKLKEQYLTAKYHDKYLLDIRISRLESARAIILLGGRTDQELNCNEYKIIDGINAVKQAMIGGVVQGGGVALKEIAKIIKKRVNRNHNRNYLFGKKCFHKSILVIFKVLEYNYSIVDENDGILDSTIIIKTIINNATAIAKMLILSSALLTYQHKYDDEMKFN